jgi:hypothetical protein
MKRSLIALALALALTAPASAQPLARAQHHARSTWSTVWGGFLRVVGAPFRLFDDGGTHIIPIISPTPAPGSGS